jgi:hypothetical protein
MLRPWPSALKAQGKLAALAATSPLFPNSHWMNTMYRCVFAAITAVVIAAPAAAQVQRAFPQNALRGAIVIGNPPEITLNGQAARLAPGARIRNQNNLPEMSASITGQRLLVNYTVDTSGLVKDVWILRPEEAANRPWPTTQDELQSWSFDPIAQVWTKP